MGITIDGPGCLTTIVPSSVWIPDISNYEYSVMMTLPDSAQKDRVVTFRYLNPGNHYGFNTPSSNPSADTINLTFNLNQKAYSNVNCISTIRQATANTSPNILVPQPPCSHISWSLIKKTSTIVSHKNQRY
jgi:hypothetical protein